MIKMTSRCLNGTFLLSGGTVLYIVFKNMEQFFTRAGEKFSNKNTPEERKKDFEDKFWNTYSFVIKSAKKTNDQLTNWVKKELHQDIQIGISEQLLKQALVDAYDDLLRLSDYHPTKTPNPIKEMAYVSFWLIKRKPLILFGESEDIINIEDAKFTNMGRMHILFINEFFASYLLLNAAFRKKKLLDVCEHKHEEAKRQLEVFQNFLFYTLVYRVESPKYLEAMIFACTLHPVWEVDPVVWNQMNEEVTEKIQ